MSTHAKKAHIQNVDTTTVRGDLLWISVFRLFPHTHSILLVSLSPLSMPPYFSVFKWFWSSEEKHRGRVASCSVPLRRAAWVLRLTPIWGYHTDWMNPLITLNQAWPVSSAGPWLTWESPRRFKRHAIPSHSPRHTPTLPHSTLHRGSFNYAWHLMIACFIRMIKETASLRLSPCTWIVKRFCSDHWAVVSYLYKKLSWALKIRRSALWNCAFHLSLPSHQFPISDAISGFKLLSVSLNGKRDWCLFSRKATGLWCAQTPTWEELNLLLGPAHLGHYIVQGQCSEGLLFFRYILFLPSARFFSAWATW